MFLGTWSSPDVSGQRPPPCAYFSFTKIDDHHVMLFGGGQPGRGMTSDLYILDLARMVSQYVHNDMSCVGKNVL